MNQPPELTLAALLTLVFAFVTTVMSNQHGTSGNIATTSLLIRSWTPGALNWILVNLHVSIQSLAVVKLFHALFAFKGEPVNNKVAHYVLVYFVAFFTGKQLVRMSVLYMGSSGAW